MNLQHEATKKAGELILTGFTGQNASQETLEFFKEFQIGGILLFAHNYSNPTQVTKLISQIKNFCNHSIWVSVDQEGGRVQRFKEGFLKVPTAAEISERMNPKEIFELSFEMARELKNVGVNLNFAPVADINTNPNNPVIGDRAFGSNEAKVSEMVTAFVRGHLKAGIHPCVKHFPGHGDTDLDSHFALPSVDTSLETQKIREWLPFQKAFKSGCRLVMTAHILVPSLDKDFPITFSKNGIQNILRKECRFDGIVISDDLEMQAITDHYSPEEAPILALEADCDLLIYRTENAARIGLQSIHKAIQNGRLDPSRILDKVSKLQEEKNHHLG